MAEVWKPIPGYDGLYEVSNHGRIRSYKRGGTKVSDRPRLLNPSRHPHGYPTLTLSHNNIPDKRLIHRLVAKLFIGDSPTDKPFVCHKDDNPENNHIDNLYWGSQKDNKRDQERNGNTAKGERCGRSKLSKEDVLDIRNANNLGCFTQQELADAFMTTQTNIYKIANRKSWKHL